MNRKTQFNVWYWVAAFLGLMLIQYAFTTAREVARVPYSQFETLLEEGKIAEVAVSDRFIQGTLKEPLERDRRAYLTPNELVGGPRERDYSEETAAAIDAKVRQIADRTFERTVALLSARRDVLERAARRLVERETFDENEPRQLLGSTPLEAANN
jgi:ATP-dependent Zn protease